jgi:hypothetical protein
MARVFIATNSGNEAAPQFAVSSPVDMDLKDELGVGYEGMIPA